MPRNVCTSRKIRRNLCRVHAVAPKVQEPESQIYGYDYPESTQVTEPVKSNIFQDVVTDSIKSNIFQSVAISPEVLKQKLPSYSKKDKVNLEVRNVINQKKLTDEKNEMKKIPVRRKIPFIELVTSAREFLKKREKEKQKAKESILTNFNALEEALPALDELMGKNLKDDAKPRAAKRFSIQDSEMMEDIQAYQQVLNNAQYAADPIGTITAQLKQRIESGDL